MINKSTVFLLKMKNLSLCVNLAHSKLTTADIKTYTICAPKTGQKPKKNQR